MDKTDKMEIRQKLLEKDRRLTEVRCELDDLRMEEARLKHEIVRDVVQLGWTNCLTLNTRALNQQLAGQK